MCLFTAISDVNDMNMTYYNIPLKCKHRTLTIERINERFIKLSGEPKWSLVLIDIIAPFLRKRADKFDLNTVMEKVFLMRDFPLRKVVPLFLVYVWLLQQGNKVKKAPWGNAFWFMYQRM